MKSAATKIIPKLLNFEQKQLCMDTAQGTLTAFNNDPDLFKKTHDVANHVSVMAMTLKQRPNYLFSLRLRR